MAAPSVGPVDPAVARAADAQRLAVLGHGAAGDVEAVLLLEDLDDGLVRQGWWPSSPATIERTSSRTPAREAGSSPDVVPPSTEARAGTSPVNSSFMGTMPRGVCRYLP
jgi:hypothetical protein